MKVINYEFHMKQFSQFFWYFLAGSNILSTVFSDILNVWARYLHRVRKALKSFEARLKIGFT
jgi:hypothetical protein